MSLTPSERMRLSATARRRHPECPECGYEMGTCDNALPREAITHWGDDGPTRFYCGYSDADLIIGEHVTRTWTIVMADRPGNGSLEDK